MTGRRPGALEPPMVRIARGDGASRGSHVAGRELPFRIAVVGDFEGDRPGERPPIRERPFLEVHRDDFDEVLSRVAPRLALRVPHPLSEEAGERAVEIRFERLADFEPEALLKWSTRLDAASAGGLDGAPARQLDALLHDPAFQRLEASWRGLRRLVDCCPDDGRVRVSLLSARKAELVGDATGRASGDPLDTGLRAAIAARHPVDEPCELLVVDFELENTSPDVGLLASLGALGETGCLTVLTGAAPSLFGLDRFRDAEGLAHVTGRGDPSASWQPLDPLRIENREWMRFRDSDDARAVAIAVPHLLGRPPHALAASGPGSVAWRETVGDPATELLWINGAWALAERIAAAVATHGWPAAIEGPDGGRVEDVPVFAARDGRARSTDWILSPEEADALFRTGFAPLCTLYDGLGVTVAHAPSAHLAPRYDVPEATAAARAMARLPYRLCLQRFATAARSLLAAARFETAEEAQAALAGWLDGYVQEPGEASDRQLAERPLRAAEATVVPRDGAWRVVLWLTPHFQLEPVRCRVAFDLPETSMR